MHKILQQLKCALGVCSVEIACRFIGENDARIVCQRTCDGNALLFASGKMPAGPSQLVAQAHAVKQFGSAIAHLCIRELTKLTHWDHHIFLRSEVLHQEMELKDEADEFVPLLRELIVAEMGHRFGFDGNTPGVRCIEQTENIEQRAFATPRRADHGVNASSLDLKRHTAQSVHAFLFFPEM